MRSFIMMTTLVTILIVTILFTTATVGQQHDQQSNQQQDQRNQNNDKDFVIAGYLPDYRSYINLNASSPYLTDVMLFSVVPHSKRSGMIGGCCLDDHHYQQAREARSYRESAVQSLSEEESSTSTSSPLRIWVTVGGGGPDRSGPFAKTASDPTKRKRFIAALKRLCEKEGIDGIDLNVFPMTKQSDIDEFIEFIEDASDILRPAGVLLSMTVHYIYHVLFPTRVFTDLVDRVNIMTYDIIEPRKGGGGGGGGGKRSKKKSYYEHHASIDKVKQSIQSFIDDGCPKHKIIVGIPEYGRHEENPNSIKTFAEIYDEMSEDERTAILQKKTDSNTNTKSNNSWNGYLYDPPDVIRQKVKLVLEDMNVGGIFFWELGQDKQHETIAPGGILLETAYDEVTQLVRKKSNMKKDHENDGISTSSNDDEEL